jgi:hypothetical protein
MLGALAITTAVFAVLAWLLLLLVGRYLGKRAVWIVGLLLAGFLVYSIASEAIRCNTPPEYIPPDCDDSSVCGDGAMIFACDGPGGVVSYAYIRIFGPLTTCLVLFLTFWVAQRPRHKKLEK